MRLLVRWAVTAIAIWVAIEMVPGIDHTGTAASLFLIALVFGLVNALVRPFLTILTCPFIILTLGLFTLVINALMLGLTAWLVPSLSVDGFLPALIGSLIISVVSGFMNAMVKDERESRTEKEHG